jgi:hypothetical protein
VKVRQFNEVSNDVFKVILNTEDWSEADQALMEKFGEPEIDVGGIFTGPPGYSMPSDLVKLASESPFVAGFDLRDFANAQARATVWGTAITLRISTAITTLRSQTDTFTKELVTVI